MDKNKIKWVGKFLNYIPFKHKKKKTKLDRNFKKNNYKKLL